jgi:hypothetical protein
MLSSIMQPAEVGVLLEKWRSICLPAERIVTVVTAALNPVGFYGVGYTPEGQFCLVALTEKSAEPEGRKGDVSHAGVCVQAGADLLVAPYVLRLVCQNGLSLPPEVIPGSTPGDEIERRLSETLAIHSAKAEELLTRYVKKAAVPVQDFWKRVQTLCEELDLGITRVYIPVINYLEHLGKPATEYDIINAIARLGERVPEVKDLPARMVMDVTGRTQM